MSSVQTAKETASGGAGVGPSRRKWDIDEYTQKARERDREDKERAEENAERLRKGEWQPSVKKDLSFSLKGAKLLGEASYRKSTGGELRS